MNKSKLESTGATQIPSLWNSPAPFSTNPNPTRYSSIASNEEIEQFNSLLDDWENREGYKVNIKENQVCIDSYEKTTINILKKLIEFSNNSNESRTEDNKKYLKECFEEIDDVKKQAIKNVFVKSNILLIYGAAGTGKTTLINHIARLSKNETKLFNEYLI